VSFTFKSFVFPKVFKVGKPMELESNKKQKNLFSQFSPRRFLPPCLKKKIDGKNTNLLLRKIKERQATLP